MWGFNKMKSTKMKFTECCQYLAIFLTRYFEIICHFNAMSTVFGH